MKRGRFLLAALLALMAVFLFVARPQAQTQPSTSASPKTSPFAPAASGIPNAVPTIGVPASASAAAAPSASAAPSTSAPVASASASAPPPPSEPPPSSSAPLTSLPLDVGLPIIVKTGVYFASISSLDETEKTFEATVDVRLVWRDPRLKFPRKDAPLGFHEFRGADAEARLQTIWYPAIMIANLVGEPTLTLRSLRISSDGRVELLQRTVAKFATEMDHERFPFDHQELRIELASLRDSREHVILDFRQDDIDFSTVARSVEIADWEIGLLRLRRDSIAGWYGESHARLVASVEVIREPTRTAPAIFIPLLASLFIPLLAIWLERVEDDDFAIEAFELANIVIGGLFAVIALNFTILGAFSSLAGSDNTVTRLFNLNYTTLAIAAVANLVLFRFKVLKRWFGKHVPVVVYEYMIWALPVLVLATAVGTLLLAWV